jgi:transposase-like protein
MKTISQIRCPRCKTKMELNGINPTGTYWMDNKGKFHWECFECDYEWIGGAKG